MKNKPQIIASLLIAISSLGLVACNSDNNDTSETKAQLIQNNAGKITTYKQLLSAFKNGDKFMIKYYINRNYTEKKLKADHQGLKSVSNSLYIHHFTSGELENNGDIQFSGSKDWISGGQTYLHTYKYTFKPSNDVKIMGGDTLIEIPTNASPLIKSNAKYNLLGHLGGSVEVYSYK